jgi:hypothetical protein
MDFAPLLINPHCHRVNIIELLDRISRDLDSPFLVMGDMRSLLRAIPEQRATSMPSCKEHRIGWTDALRAAGYECISDQPTFAQFAGQPWDWPVDLMFVNETTFQKMWAERVSTTIAGSAAYIPAPTHLVALKLHALKFGPERRAQKDLEDIVEIVIANQISDKLRDLCDRFGTAELYERIKTALGKQP